MLYMHLESQQIHLIIEAELFQLQTDLIVSVENLKVCKLVTVLYCGWNISSIPGMQQTTVML